MKTCDALEDLLPLHAIGETDLDEAMAVEDHLRRCTACREHVEAYTALAGTLRQEMGQVPPVPADLNSTERAAYRSPPVSSPGSSRRWPRLALAAGLLLAGLLVGRYTTSPEALPVLSGRTPAGPPPILSAGVNARRGRAMLSVFAPSVRAYLKQLAVAEDADPPTTSP